MTDQVPEVLTPEEKAKRERAERDRAKILAGSVLSTTAGVSSAIVDRFVSWLVAGAGAVLGLLIANLDTIDDYIHPSTLANAGIIYLVAAALTVVHKAMAAWVMAGAEGAKTAIEADPANPFDLAVFVEEVEIAMFPPMRSWVASAINQAMEGDLASGGRRLSKVSQAQTLLALVISFLVIWSLGVVIRGVAT